MGASGHMVSVLAWPKPSETANSSFFLLCGVVGPALSLCIVGALSLFGFAHWAPATCQESFSCFPWGLVKSNTFYCVFWSHRYFLLWGVRMVLHTDYNLRHHFKRSVHPLRSPCYWVTYFPEHSGSLCGVWQSCLGKKWNNPPLPSTRNWKLTRTAYIFSKLYLAYDTVVRSFLLSQWPYAPRWQFWECLPLGKKADLLPLDIWLLVGGCLLLHRASFPNCFPGKVSIWGHIFLNLRAVTQQGQHFVGHVRVNVTVVIEQGRHMGTCLSKSYIRPLPTQSLCIIDC